MTPNRVGARLRSERRRQGRRAATVLVALLASLLLAACTRPLLRIEQGALVGYGQNVPGGAFDALSIDLERRGANGVPLFCVQLADDAPPLRSDALTPERVSRYLPPFRVPRYWPETWRSRAAAYDRYEGNGYVIAFRDGVLSSISLGMRQSDPVEPVTHPTTPARVGPADCSRLYTLPLSLEQFREVFGPPDRMHPVREVYVDRAALDALMCPRV